MAILIRRVDLEDVWPAPREAPRHVDIRIEGSRIVEIAPRIEPRADDAVFEGGGATALPGLHDHHVHLMAWAAAASSILVDPAHTTGPTQLAARLLDAPGGTGSWVRAIGYDESVAGHLDRRVLDRLVPGRPVRVQHRTGALWILNSRALAAIGLSAEHALPPELPETQPGGIELDESGRPTGRFWRADRWLRERLASAVPAGSLDLGDLSARSAAAGVTGFTEATPNLEPAEVASFVDHQADHALLQRVHVLSPLRPLPDGLDVHPVDYGRGEPLISLGAVKIMLDDDRLPHLDGLIDDIRWAHDRALPVAIHCVTQTQAALSVAAWSTAGTAPGDRMEHAAVLDHDLVSVVRRLGLTVVTQPGMLFARGDRYAADVDVDDLRNLWRLGSLLEAGIPVAMSTDAPYGPENPWMAVRAASRRITRDGRVLSPEERVSARRALSLFLTEAASPGLRRTLAPGGGADLVLLRDSLDEALEDDAPAVLATFIGGRVVYRNDGTGVGALEPTPPTARASGEQHAAG